MHYQVFIPGAEAVGGAELLIGVGLADFVHGAEFTDISADRSPNAEAGQLVSWRRPGQKATGFNPDRQRWIPAAAYEGLERGRYMVGFWTDSPPTPEDLARPYMERGRSVEFNGTYWVIPDAKELERDLIIADDGTWKYEVQRRFHKFSLECVRWLQFLARSERSTQVDYEDILKFVLQGLRINYRILPEVASELRMFTTRNLPEAIEAIFVGGV